MSFCDSYILYGDHILAREGIGLLASIGLLGLDLFSFLAFHKMHFCSWAYLERYRLHELVREQGFVWYMH